MERLEQVAQRLRNEFMKAPVPKKKTASVSVPVPQRQEGPAPVHQEEEQFHLQLEEGEPPKTPRIRKQISISVPGETQTMERSEFHLLQEAKELLALEQSKSQKLSEQVAALEKENETVRADFLHQESLKWEALNKFKRRQDEFDMQVEKLEDAEEALASEQIRTGILTGQVNELQREVDSLKNDLEYEFKVKQELEKKLSKKGAQCTDQLSQLNEHRTLLISEQSKAEYFSKQMDKLQTEIDALENSKKEDEIKSCRKEGDLLERQRKLEEIQKLLVTEQTNAENLMEQVNNLQEEISFLRTSQEEVEKMLKDKEAEMLEHQDNLEETRKLLLLEQLETEKVYRQVAALQKENNALKNDLQVEINLRKDFEQKLGGLEDFQVSKKVFQKEIGFLKDQLDALENSKKEVETTLTHKEGELLEFAKKLEETLKLLTSEQSKSENLMQQLASLQEEVGALKMKAKECDNLEAVIAKKTEIINEKTELIEEKEKKLKALQNNVDLLKEASSVLDTQLKEFESILNQKLSELQAATKYKEVLENENREIREQLKNCRIELNEARSLKVFTEKKLEKTETTLKTQTETNDTECHLISEKLDMAAARNEELSKEVTTLITQVSSIEDEKFLLRQEIETIRGEKERLDKEVYSLVKSVVAAKEEISSLKDALKETLGKAESYKEKFVASNTTFAELEQAKQTSDLMLTTRIEQQEKLIDYLREQLEAYQDKDKNKPSTIFTPKRTEKEPFGRKSQQSSTLSTPKKVTPKEKK